MRLEIGRDRVGAKIGGSRLLQTNQLDNIRLFEERHGRANAVRGCDGVIPTDHHFSEGLGRFCGEQDWTASRENKIKSDFKFLGRSGTWRANRQITQQCRSFDDVWGISNSLTKRDCDCLAPAWLGDQTRAFGMAHLCHRVVDSFCGNSKGFRVAINDRAHDVGR